jgi:cytidine deaminase
MKNLTSCIHMNKKEQLISEAKSAMEYSYNPYSHFRVGAAIRAEDDGTIFTGTNMRTHHTV